MAPIEPIPPNQLAPALRLSEGAGWNQTEADWRLFAEHGTLLGIAQQGRLVATAAALPYGAAFGWVSMVIVDPAWRGQGLATRLVAACTDILRAAGRAALLDATPAGAGMYARFGYVPLGGSVRMERAPNSAVITAPSEPVSSSSDLIRRSTRSDRHMRPITPPDARNATTQATAAARPQTRQADHHDLTPDAQAFGANRIAVLREFLTRPGSAAFASTAGVAILRPGLRAAQLGPVAAAPAEGPDLVARAIAATAGPLFIDVLGAGHALLPGLAAAGFREQRRFTRMALGRCTLPGDPARMLAAAGPEFG